MSLSSSTASSNNILLLSYIDTLYSIQNPTFLSLQYESNGVGEFSMNYLKCIIFFLSIFLAVFSYSFCFWRWLVGIVMVVVTQSNMIHVSYFEAVNMLIACKCFFSVCIKCIMLISYYWVESSSPNQWWQRFNFYNLLHFFILYPSRSFFPSLFAIQMVPFAYYVFH